MKDRPHWSYSSISQYLRCPLQFFFKRVMQLPEPTVSSSLVFGSAVHSALAEYHRHLQEGRSCGPASLHDVVNKSWLERERHREVAYKKRESRDELISKAQHIVDIYLEEPPPENIVAIEESVTVPIQNSKGEYLETPLVAVTDLVVRSGDSLKITEIKTSGRAYGEFEVTTSLQPTCYVNAAFETYGEMAEVEYTVLVKTKTPRLQRLQTSRNERDLGRLGDLVETIERAIDANLFYPIENPLNCSSCPFREPCREWTPGRPSAENLVDLQIPSEVVKCSSN